MDHVDERWQQLRAAFQAELDDRMRTLNQLVLTFERGENDAVPADEGHRTQTLDAMLRELHSLKGASRAVELEHVEHLAHAVEASLQRVRQSQEHPDGPWFDTLYGALDLFPALCRAAAQGEPPPVIFQELLAELDFQSDSQRLAQPVESTLPTIPTEAQPEGTPSELVSAKLVGDSAPARLRTESVRVAVEKLDLLFSQSGELAVATIRIEQRFRDVKRLRSQLRELRHDWRARNPGRNGHPPAALAPGGGSEVGHHASAPDRLDQQLTAAIEEVDQLTALLQEDTSQLAAVSRAIEDEVMSVRLLPIAPLFMSFERMVRDLTRATGKQVQLLTRGGEIELDRRILEELRDPLMHMLRNAVDHGIEPPASRMAAGKPEGGIIRLSAAHREGQVEIEVADDGQGIDPAHLRDAALRNKRLSVEQVAALDDQEALDLMFLPGLSTRHTVTETSGRGVGMDVVRESLERIHGRLSTASVVGQGTRFTISVPLTLATTRAILVEVQGQPFAVPSWMVERCTRSLRRDLVRIEGKFCLTVEKRAVPVVELATVLELPAAVRERRDAGDWVLALVLRQGDHVHALLVDRLVGEQELTVKRLPWPLRKVRNLDGAAVLEAGETVIILNPLDLLESAMRVSVRALSASDSLHDDREADQPRIRLLVVDDSLTTRTLERSILEAAGYEVLVASDGAEALQVLGDNEVDLLVSDVDMPNMDGFALTAAVRADPRLRQVPVILVTSLETPDHKARGVEVGADAYIVKRGFDQGQLLEAIGRLL